MDQEHIQAYLVGIRFPGTTQLESTTHLEELSQLVETMGGRCVGSLIASIDSPQAKFLVGQGKAEEIRQQLADLEAEVLIFDTDLSPTQQRNWERFTQIPVIDRQQVIIEIFSQRAQTKEARLQVELAQLEYSMPRLTRAWTHLSRQRGGTKGTKGEGETQLEIDKRIVKRRISKLKSELETVRKQRATGRKAREAVPVFTAALVGYTNAGKSSLLKTLTSADVLIEDKLFATLDPTTRRLALDDGFSLLVTDTVGFIRKLPHNLVDAFQSTLEETLRADLLIHVLDGSSPEIVDHWQATRDVLKEIGADEIPSLVVLNKADLISKDEIEHTTRFRFTDSILVSAKTGQGIENLLGLIKNFAESRLSRYELELPYAREDLTALCHREGVVDSKEYVDHGIRLTVRLPKRFVGLIEPYLVRSSVES
jgi:GTP-binding protein HflX